MSDVIDFLNNIFQRSEYQDELDLIEEKKSPYKPETLAKYKKKFEDGEKIPFGVEASLKAQGMIPRADGKYVVSDDYKEAGVKADPSLLNKVTKSLSPEKSASKSHAEKVEQRLKREEKERNAPKKDKLIKAHPTHVYKDKSHVDDEHFIANRMKKQIAKSDKDITTKKQYSPKAKHQEKSDILFKKKNEGEIPTFYEILESLNNEQ